MVSATWDSSSERDLELISRTRPNNEPVRTEQVGLDLTSLVLMIVPIKQPIPKVQL